MEANLELTGDFWYYLNYGDLAKIETFIHNGTNVNEREEYLGMTPLQIAIDKGDLNKIELLLKLGADPNLPDDLNHLPLNYGGNTPLHYAVNKENFEIVKLLLKYGADPMIADCDDQLPIDIAKQRHLTKIVEILH